MNLITYFQDSSFYRETFDKAGGKMMRTDCEDYLFVPQNAIPSDEQYTIVEVTPLYIANPEALYTDGDYVPFVFKEYQLYSEKQKTLCKFLKHVKIVTYYYYNEVGNLNETDIKVCYSTNYGIYEFAEYDNGNKDIYYVLNKSRIVIFAKHFTTFITYRRDWKKLFARVKIPRTVTLVADIYSNIENSNDEKCIVVYIRDIHDHAFGRNCQEKNDEREKKNRRQCIVHEDYLCDLPGTIHEETKFGCYISYNTTHWADLELEVLLYRLRNS